LENKKEVTTEELEDNLTLYFDGLLSGLSKVDSTKFTKSKIEFKQNQDTKDNVDFIGTLDIFDGFATQEQLTLNGRVYSSYCEEKDQLILLFRFSPLAFEHSIWDKLRTVKVRSTVCEE
jgi:hypothetical protein